MSNDEQGKKRASARRRARPKANARAAEEPANRAPKGAKEVPPIRKPAKSAQPRTAKKSASAKPGARRSARRRVAKASQPRQRSPETSEVDAPSSGENTASAKRIGARRAAAQKSEGTGSAAARARPVAKAPKGLPKRPSASRTKRKARVSITSVEKNVDCGGQEISSLSEGGAVLVTGICGRLGKLLARRLHRVEDVIGIDRRPFPEKPKDIVHHRIDLRRKKTRDVFRGGGIRAVVHLGIMHDPRASAKIHHAWNVVAFQKLLEYMVCYKVPKLVLLSSATVYGPSADNPQFLTEEAPLLGSAHFSGIRDLVEVDMLAQSFFWRHPDTETVILRPSHILGNVRNAPSNYLRLDRPLTLMGFDPMVQVIHEKDVVAAIQLALRPGVRGIFNLKGPGELPMSRIMRILGKRSRSIPSSLARPLLNKMWRYRMTNFPAPELDYLRYVCMVDDTRARQQLGYAPSFSVEETVQAVVAV